MPNAVVRDTCLAIGAAIALATVAGTMWFIFPLLLATMYGLTASAIHFALLAAVTFAAAFFARWLLDQLGGNKRLYAASLIVALSTASGIGSWWMFKTLTVFGLLVVGLFLGVGMGILLTLAFASLTTLFRNGHSRVAGGVIAGSGLGLFALASLACITFGVGLVAHLDFTSEGVDPVIAVPGIVYLGVAVAMALAVLGASVRLARRFTGHPASGVGIVVAAALISAVVAPTLIGYVALLLEGIPAGDLRPLTVLWFTTTGVESLNPFSAVILVDLPHEILRELGVFTFFYFSALLSGFGFLTASLLILVGLSPSPDTQTDPDTSERPFTWTGGAALVGAATLAWLTTIVHPFGPHGDYGKGPEAMSVTSFALLVGAVAAWFLAESRGYAQLLSYGFVLLGAAVLGGGIVVALSTSSPIMLVVSGVAGIGFGAVLALLLRGISLSPGLRGSSGATALATGLASGALVGALVPGTLMTQLESVEVPMLVVAAFGVATVVLGMRYATTIGKAVNVR